MKINTSIVIDFDLTMTDIMENKSEKKKYDHTNSKQMTPYQ